MKNIPTGRDVPHEVNVVIEIPAHGDPVKYEVDKESGALWVDRFLNTAMYYPCNYGYVPNTLSEDGDPVDVLVVTPVPLLSGSVISVRPIGVLYMSDESGRDVKVLAVPGKKCARMYQHIQSYKDVSEHLIATITHFFEHYKDLDPGKWVKVEGWHGPDEARQEILASIERYQAHEKNTSEKSE